MTSCPAEILRLVGLEGNLQEAESQGGEGDIGRAQKALLKAGNQSDHKDMTFSMLIISLLEKSHFSTLFLGLTNSIYLGAADTCQLELMKTCFLLLKYLRNNKNIKQT